MTGENLLISIFVGLFAGWLVDMIGRGVGLPLAGSLSMAVFGAILGGLLLPLTGLNFGNGLVVVVINAAIGAAILLFVIKLIRPDDDPGKMSNGQS